jgi:sulfide dehydrogenase cytochrome subunit
MTPTRPWRAAATAALLALPSALLAQTPSQTLHLRALAATCANCHGTDGRAVEDGGNVALRGMNRDHFLKQMAAFRDGSRPATVMHQLVKGYTPEQVEQLAAYFAAPK